MLRMIKFNEASGKGKPAKIGNEERSVVLGVLNIRSIITKFSSIYGLIHEGLDIFVLTESWHGSADNISIGLSMPPGYQFVDRLRSHDPHHGGLIIFFRSIFRYKKITLPLATAFEVLVVKLKINELDYILLAIYRPGSEQLTTSFFDELISVLECVTIISSRILLAGDFNIHMEKSNNPNVVNLREIFEMFQLINHIDEPSHILGGTLDLIVTSHNIAVSEAKVYPSGIYSDHGLVQVLDKEDRLKNLVAPIESYIKSAEVLLTWEFPFASALFTNAIFVLLIWIQVQTRNEGEFDLISTVAWLVVTFETIWSNGMQLRKDDRDKFLLIDELLSNNFSTIITVTFVLLWPVVKYNKLAASVISFFAVLERFLNIKRTVNPRKVRRQLRKQMVKENIYVRNMDEIAEDHGDDSDAELREFIPPEESFPPLMEGSKYDENIDEQVYEDEDSDAQEFLPDESILSDSRDATDDEYLPNEPSSLFADEKFGSSEHPLSGDMSGNKINTSDINKGAVANTGKAAKKENDKDANDGFSDGLTFENVDKYDYVGDIKQNATSRLGSFLNQATNMGKTLAGFSLLKYTLGSVIGSSTTAESVNPAKNNRESPVEDDQFDLSGVELEAFAIPDN
ncbi:hypothetical protein HELRODRAFT_161457 [Helobdella robusta]|uniref:Endonuclease/exonuclease/phosphatase domain-containing protein n=1 Tax=Helobdella robusta TaxID=6412 RepID=T1ERH6_HELRO|nr:hypothetical protein HELRODRAFT_161457 [Helobdella robusta]ESO02214.1 hypothetical protein HELRODRAFT_161457 [Helobdella robusta]